MLECKMISRKPFICYSVVLDSRKVFLVKSEKGSTERSKRWKMIVSPDEDLFFSSKRSALRFFQTGEKFKTKPVYASGKGKTQKRIR
jgi:hypothetical protein